MGPWPNVLNAYATAILHTIDSLKFQHPNYSAPSRALIAFYSKVWQASQIFKAKIWQFEYVAAVYICYN